MQASKCLRSLFHLYRHLSTTNISPQIFGLHAWNNFKMNTTLNIEPISQNERCAATTCYGLMHESQ